MKKDKETLVDEIEKLKEAFRQIKISLIKEFKDILIKIFPDYEKYLKHIYLVLQIIFLLFMTCLLIK
nr:MAG TPA: hypothetical protein [Caudoviricetes sp.]